MIVTRTPLRISFFSGGSDIETFYKEEKGAALSATIDKYVYVSVYETLDRTCFIHNDNVEMSDIDKMQHNITRETLKLFNRTKDVTVTSITNIYCNGSGLGSSSAYTVGLINTMPHTMTPRGIAEKACQIEIDICGYPIGKQDQYAAAYGGLNLFEFDKNGFVETKERWSSNNILANLAPHLILVYTGRTRETSTILNNLKKELKHGSRKFELIKQGRDWAYKGYDLLLHHKFDAFGELLHEAWSVKKQITPDATWSDVDDMYTLARQQGALGGKVLGAGGGGYMILYARIDDKPNVLNVVKKSGFKSYDFNFTSEGSSVILSS